MWTPEGGGGGTNSGAVCCCRKPKFASNAILTFRSSYFSETGRGGLLPRGRRLRACTDIDVGWWWVERRVRLKNVVRIPSGPLHASRPPNSRRRGRRSRGGGGGDWGILPVIFANHKPPLHCIFITASMHAYIHRRHRRFEPTRDALCKGVRIQRMNNNTRPDKSTRRPPSPRLRLTCAPVRPPPRPWRARTPRTPSSLPWRA